MRYYKRDGTAVADYSQALAGEKHVAQDYLDEGYLVSTVHLGLDHRYGDGPPLIFETMVFAQADGEVASYSDLYCDRYSTEAAAAAGHAEVVARIKAGTLDIDGAGDDDA